MSFSVERAQVHNAQCTGRERVALVNQSSGEGHPRSRLATEPAPPRKLAPESPNRRPVPRWAPRTALGRAGVARDIRQAGGDGGKRQQRRARVGVPGVVRRRLAQPPRHLQATGRACLLLGAASMCVCVHRWCQKGEDDWRRPGSRVWPALADTGMHTWGAGAARLPASPPGRPAPGPWTTR